jgi:IclR family transcriptional regulator, acetate operon repressor
MSNGAEDGSRHVGRTLRALELISIAPRSQAELARQLGVHPRTVRRLLARLEAEGFASRVPGARSEYSATLKIVTLAGHVLERADFARSARPFVTHLQTEIGEAAFLAVPADDSTIHILYEPARTDVSVRSRLGEKVPYHCSAFGKALLAHLPERLEELIAHPLARFTDRTITDPAELLLQLAEVRRRGWSEDNGEYASDVRSVAAPVFDHTHRVKAAVGISAPAHRIGEHELQQIGPVVAVAAVSLSNALGFVTGHVNRPVEF